VPPADIAYMTWQGWNPIAGFFHSATRGSAWTTPHEREQLMADLVAKARARAVPPPVKRGRSGRSVSLPAAATDGEFPSVLLSRRTWRTFSRAAVSIDDLATLLALSAGVQMWGVSGAGNVRVPFKTSPSAGAKHPLEVYVLARRVSGLRPAVYHYIADDHRLERVGGAVTSRQVEWLLGRQWYFRNAPAIVLVTAVWARTQWTYGDARAYRSVLAEAGHLCQTFCLTATWLNLAPFCTMALAEADIDRVLRIDGITESVLYAMGAGARPAEGWVQWPAHAPGRPSFPPPPRTRSRRDP
jgi:SagB-type dehydrogenase family enzyme